MLVYCLVNKSQDYFFLFLPFKKIFTVKSLIYVPLFPSLTSSSPPTPIQTFTTKSYAYMHTSSLLDHFPPTYLPPFSLLRLFLGIKYFAIFCTIIYLLNSLLLNNKWLSIFAVINSSERNVYHYTWMIFKNKDLHVEFLDPKVRKI